MRGARPRTGGSSLPRLGRVGTVARESIYRRCGGEEHCAFAFRQGSAISNDRIERFAEDRATFTWKDHAHGGRRTRMTLEALQFVHRFLLHVVPKGFVRIRHFGFVANRVRGEKLARIRALLGRSTPRSGEEPGGEPAAEQPAGPACPACGAGSMCCVESLSSEQAREACVGRPEPG